LTERRACPLEGEPKQKRRFNVGEWYDDKGKRHEGRRVVYECPEGISLLWGWVIQKATLSLQFGFQDGKPWGEQDARFVQAVLAVKEVRRGG
jgi:hypothetical protein